MKQGTPRAATRLSILVGVCLAAAFAGVALIQKATGEEEAWDTGFFWPFALGGGLLLGAVFVRSARGAFFVGAAFAASILVASFALSRDDQGANHSLFALFTGPWLALVIGCAAWLGGSVVAHLPARTPFK